MNAYSCQVTGNCFKCHITLASQKSYEVGTTIISIKNVAGDVESYLEPDLNENVYYTKSKGKTSLYFT